MDIIQTQTLTETGTSTISFVGIPADFNDLIIKISARSNTSNQRTNLFLRPNGETTSQLDRRILGYNSSNKTSATSSAITMSVNGATSTSNSFSNTEVYITNYKASVRKSFIAKSAPINDESTSYLIMETFGRWTSSAAISSVDLVLAAGNFMTGTTVSLYGIAAGSL